jgi:plastocyanin domain-containing protein
VTPADIVVLVVGAGLILWELWYFLAPRKVAAAVSRTQKGSGPQEVNIVVKGGYDPDTILVEAGRPVRLNFYRDETADCSERLVFEAFGIDQQLPAFQTTTIQFTPATPGDYVFRCGMSMLKGRVVAQAGGDEARANAGRGHNKHG